MQSRVTSTIFRIQSGSHTRCNSLSSFHVAPWTKRAFSNQRIYTSLEHSAFSTIPSRINSSTSCNIYATNKIRPTNSLYPVLVEKRPTILLRANLSTKVNGPSHNVNGEKSKISPNPFANHASTNSPFHEIIDFDSFSYNPKEATAKIIKAAQWQNSKSWDPQISRDAVRNYILHLRYILQLQQQDTDIVDAEQNILSSHTASLAIQSLLRTKTQTAYLSTNIRHIERLLGSLQSIPMTNQLSFALLHANGKAGNIGRTMQLLALRKEHKFKPKKYEFQHAIQSIISAGLDLRKHRNVYVPDEDDMQDPIDNPTRWLDAILINMEERGVTLDIKTANLMLNCFASTGRNAKATYWFFQVGKSFDKDSKERKIRMKINKSPENSKIPSLIREKAREKGRDDDVNKKLQLELKSDFSVPLHAAFLFSESLTHGAYGHQPIKLDIVSYNTLIKACCYHGALWRALNLLNKVMPGKGIDPDTYSYNAIMHGLARVGDTNYLKSLLTTMTNRSIPLDKYTVQALVDGSLNEADISGTISLVQDVFNQHSVLPPYTSHLKIMEFALANDMLFEAKRYLFFMQQLWNMHENSFTGNKELMLTIQNPKIGKEAIKKLFKYYGVDLSEDDFSNAQLPKGRRWGFF